MAAAAPPPQRLSLRYPSTFIKYCRARTTALTKATANVANDVLSCCRIGKLLRRRSYFDGSDGSDVVEDARPRSEDEGAEPKNPGYGEYIDSPPCDARVGVPGMAFETG
eukprot:6078185-Pleurochrysis_carterae.AAC.4